MLITIITTYYQSKVSGIILAILMYYLNNTYYENYTTSKSEYAKSVVKNEETQLIGFDGSEKIGTEYNYKAETFDIKGKCPCPNNLYPVYSNCYSTLKTEDKKICDNLVSMPSSSSSNATSPNSTTTTTTTTTTTGTNNLSASELSPMETNNLTDFKSLEPVTTKNNYVSYFNNSETKLKNGKWKHFKILFDNNNKMVKPDRFKFVNNVCDINNYNCDYIIQEESMRPKTSTTSSSTPSTTQPTTQSTTTTASTIMGTSSQN